MALPLDPVSGMFPETYVEPFIEAPELAELAADVIASFDEFEPIQTAMREAGLRIAYAWETKPFDPLKDDLKPHTIAKTTKASPLWRLLAATELAIQFRQAFWDPFTDAQRRAVIHHELTHIKVTEPGDDGKVHLSLRKHDVEDFTKTMRRFGPIIPGRAAFVKAFDDWRHEQHPPEPTHLRAVEDIAADVAKMPIADQAVIGAALDFRRSVEAGSIDVTVTAGGRSTTIKGRKDQALADATAHKLGRSPAAPRGSAQAAARPASDERIGTLVCQGSNHVPGHTADCPRFGQS